MKRIIILLLTAAYLNFTAGCASSGIMLVSDLKDNPDEYIEEAVLLNQSTVKFINGGYYQTVPPVITGKLDDGSEADILIEDVVEFRLSKPHYIKLQELNNKSVREIILNDNSSILFNEKGGIYNIKENNVTGATIGNKYITVAGDSIKVISTEAPVTVNLYSLSLSDTTRIRQLVMKDNIIYTFDEHGGEYIGSKNIITGISEAGKLTTINPDSVWYLKVPSPNAGISIFLMVATAVVISAAVFILLWEGLDFRMNWY